MSAFWGIDTSNYTTSAALSEDGEITVNERKLLPVAEGERGLRQSDALFAHTVSLPERLAALAGKIPTAVGASDVPRDLPGSYMPCFLAGVAAASAAAVSAGVPLFRFSHQAGHIAAALYSCRREDLHKSRFLAFHVSGGTTEVVLVDEGKISRLGGTRDISAGKAIDRVGVTIGLTFPCGKELEKLAGDLSGIKPGRVCVEGCDCNLSGLENQAADLLKKGADAPTVAAFTLAAVGKTLDKMTENARAAYPGLPVLYAGGVMSNRFFREFFSEKYEGLFAEPAYSCDNAAGIARLTELTFRGELPVRRERAPERA